MGNCLGNSAYFVGNLGKTVLVTLRSSFAQSLVQILAAGQGVPFRRLRRSRPRRDELRDAEEAGRLVRAREEREGRRRRHGDAQLDGAHLRRARKLQRLLN